MVLKVLFWVFVVLVVLSFLKLKNLPLWLRIGLAVVAPIFLFGLVLLLSWIFAFVILIIIIGIIIALFLRFRRI